MASKYGGGSTTTVSETEEEYEETFDEQEKTYDPSLDEYYNMESVDDVEDFLAEKSKTVDEETLDIDAYYDLYYDIQNAGFEILPEYEHEGINGITLRQDNQIYFISDRYLEFVEDEIPINPFDSAYRFSSILDEINNQPDLFHANGGKVIFAYSDQNYYTEDNEIYISVTPLFQIGQGTSYDLGHTMLHEHVHRLDFGGKGALNGGGIISNHPYFMKISDKSAASGYSLSYKNSSDPDENRKYYCENLAEAVMPMRYWSDKSTRHLAMIEDPSNPGNDMPYGDWRKSHKELAELADVVYNANSVDEVVAFMDSKL